MPSQFDPKYARELADRAIWAWLTRGGQVDPAIDPPFFGVSGTFEANLDLDSDEVAAGGEESPGGTRRLFQVDSNGRLVPLPGILSTLGKKLDPVTPTPLLVSSSGETTILAAPGSPDAHQVLWLFAQAASSISGTVVVTFKLGSRSLYTFSLEASQMWSHAAVIDGAVGEALKVSLDSAKAVYVNNDTRVFTP